MNSKLKVNKAYMLANGISLVRLGSKTIKSLSTKAEGASKFVVLGLFDFINLNFSLHPLSLLNFFSSVEDVTFQLCTFPLPRRGQNITYENMSGNSCRAIMQVRKTNTNLDGNTVTSVILGYVSIEIVGHVATSCTHFRHNRVSWSACGKTQTSEHDVGSWCFYVLFSNLPFVTLRSLRSVRCKSFTLLDSHCISCARFIGKW